MALPMDHAFDAYNAERLRSAGTLLLGAGTFRLFSGFWPAVADDPEASNDQREISRRDNAIDKVVVSDSLTGEDGGAWRETTRIVARGGRARGDRRAQAGRGRGHPRVRQPRAVARPAH